MSEYMRPAFAIILPNVGGIAGSYFQKKDKRVWYNGLKKPSWRPPTFAFAPVWTYLYSSMGYASYLVWRDGGGFKGEAALPLACYGTQLALNWAWAPIFFGARKKGLATIEIGALWGMIIATGLTFYRINKTAGYLMIPYFGWISLASCLTFNIWMNNKDRTD